MYGGALMACGLQGAEGETAAASDEWQTNSLVSDMQCTQHGQAGRGVKTARALESPGGPPQPRRRQCVCDTCENEWIFSRERNREAAGEHCNEKF